MRFACVTSLHLQQFPGKTCVKLYLEYKTGDIKGHVVNLGLDGCRDTTNVVKTTCMNTYLTRYEYLNVIRLSTIYVRVARMKTVQYWHC